MPCGFSRTKVNGNNNGDTVGAIHPGGAVVAVEGTQLMQGAADAVPWPSPHLATMMMDMGPADLHAAFHDLHQGKRDQLQQAHRVAEVIAKRDFSSEKLFLEDHRLNGLFPSGFGYGLFLGGVTYAAITVPSMMLARGLLGLSRGNPGAGPIRAGRFAVRALALVAAGTVGTRYVQRHQTLEGLKVLGTHLSPNELSASADALCRHPLITQAMEDHRKHSQWRQYAQWYNHHWQSTSWSWWLNDAQILVEFQHVLENCEKRRALLDTKERSSGQ
jgi:hypothetical protein